MTIPEYDQCDCGIRGPHAKCDNRWVRIRELELALEKLIRIADKCDGWESFPSKALDDARDVLYTTSHTLPKGK